jgi:hypothetical protein
VAMWFIFPVCFGGLGTPYLLRPFHQLTFYHQFIYVVKDCSVFYFWTFVPCCIKKIFLSKIAATMFLSKTKVLTPIMGIGLEHMVYNGIAYSIIPSVSVFYRRQPISMYSMNRTWINIINFFCSLRCLKNLK